MIERPLGLIGIDASPDSVTLVNFVRESFHPSWRWLIVHVVDLTAAAHPDTADKLESVGTGIIEEASGLLPGSTAILEHSPDIADGLRSVARDHGASTIVIGAGQHGAITSALLGSVSSELLKQAPCPVLTFRTH